MRDLVKRTVARFGRLDVLVNCAGTGGTPGPVVEQTSDSYAATFDTNVLGTILGMKHALRVMKPQGQGSVVNVSSTMGHKGAPGASIHRQQARGGRADEVGGAGEVLPSECALMLLRRVRWRPAC